MWLKKLIKKLPVINELVKRLSALDDRNDIIEYENTLLGQQLVDNRLAIKKITGEKINVVFVCHRPAVWSSLKTVYEEIKKDEHFKVTIVAIPNKKEIPGKWLYHEIYESEGAEEFWKDYGCINGYNYETGEWLDLKLLKPDYVFFQQPYNITRCPSYKSWIVSKYAKLCFVPYGLQVVGKEVFESVHPRDFMNNVSYYFSTDDLNYVDIKEWFLKIQNRITEIKVVGFPRYDLVSSHKNADSSLWKFHGDSKKFRILWTPRWCTNEGTCTFFEYKDNILDFAKAHKNVEIMFRPHPQAFSEWNTTHEMPIEEQVAFRKECENLGIIIDETGDYLNQIMSSDCIITDITSLMGEYVLAGVPIIYTHKKDYFTQMGELLKKSYYIANSWGEVEKILASLFLHNDSKKNVRQQIINDCYCIPPQGSGDLIKNIILNDALKGEPK